MQLVVWRLFIQHVNKVYENVLNPIKLNLLASLFKRNVITHHFLLYRFIFSYAESFFLMPNQFFLCRISFTYANSFFLMPIHLYLCRFFFFMPFHFLLAKVYVILCFLYLIWCSSKCHPFYISQNLVWEIREKLRYSHVSAFLMCSLIIPTKCFIFLLTIANSIQ